MILTGEAIHCAVKSGDITIDPFDRRQLNPNSYDFRLGSRCKVYEELVLDAASDNACKDIVVDQSGLVLEPDRVYLFNSEETIGSNTFVPIIRGRSSTGRLGLFVHITADLIDLGSVNQLTLQLHCVIPIRLYPGMLIGQVTFWTTQGSKVFYEGKYKGLSSPAPSLSYLDWR